MVDRFQARSNSVTAYIDHTTGSSKRALPHLPIVWVPNIKVYANSQNYTVYLVLCVK